MTHFQRRHFIAATLAPLLSGTVMRSANAQQARELPLAVLYPDASEPFKSFFARILDGIDDKLRGTTARIALPDTAQAQQVAAGLSKREPRVVIALGQVGLRVANALDGAPDIVASAITNVGDLTLRATVLQSLSPSPLLLLRQLKTLVPEARSVTVVFSPYSAWLAAPAREAARLLELTLHIESAADIRTAFAQYQAFFARAGAHDVLWLAQDPVTAEENSLLPYIMQQSWALSLPLFSSNSAHVGRGALFSLFPNNLALGRTLGALALARLNAAGNGPRSILPLQDVFGTLNTRTASHLGIDLSAQLRRNFALLLPERT